jgi:hypothetical protein
MLQPEMDDEKLVEDSRKEIKVVGDASMYGNLNLTSWQYCRWRPPTWYPPVHHDSCNENIPWLALKLRSLSIPGAGLISTHIRCTWMFLCPEFDSSNWRSCLVDLAVDAAIRRSRVG